MSANNQPVPTSTLSHNDDPYIPHMIYLLSYVMNVGGQYTEEAPVEQERKKLQNTLHLSDKVAADMKDNLGKLKKHYKAIARPFATAIGYGHVGCPKSMDTLVVLAEKWMSSSTPQ